MSINDLKEIDCKHCEKKGLRVRSRIEKELIMDEDNILKTKIYWIVLCEYCSRENKILYAENI